jgi:hypothetical protein
MKSAMLQQLSQNAPATATAEQEAEKFGKEFVTAIQNDRRTLAGSDLLRSIILMSLVLAVIGWTLKQKQYNVGIIALGILCLFDLLTVDKRYLNSERFVEASDFQNSFAMSTADTQIKQDTGYYRVFNNATDPFNESNTAYHHNSIGGYHPAKLQIYQDLIEYQISKNNMQVLNMLNMKYVIIRNPQNGEMIAQQNPDAFGPCWLVKGIKYVTDGKEEMNALDNTGLRDSAVVQNKFKADIKDMPVYDSTANLTFIQNRNDLIRYTFNAAAPQFGVFSEIYYDRGWKAFIDQKEVPIIKTNYALRGLFIPAGKHDIEFRFEPSAYKQGNIISLISSILIYIFVAGGLFWEWKRSQGQLA